MAAIGNNNINAKLVLLGDMGAGKSSLVLRFVKGQFLEFQTVAVDDGTVEFEIWDTAGQELYHSLAPMYYRGAAVAIIVHDITSMESFSRAKNWVQELQKQGNKADLEDKRKVTVEQEGCLELSLLKIQKGWFSWIDQQEERKLLHAVPRSSAWEGW